ncbi:unnamed protein product [Paramecium octaurelia]|uniref:Uncharacterized protein n=1 Tax=Paramecium octaurelia TaxID=43137 RepID=A0A8S1RYK4_PAROT|nr:unnamed protein product [Paramecium octaurelia]
MSQSSKLSLSTLKGQQPLFPTISYKTSESPSKDLVPLTNYMLIEQKQDKINANRMKSGNQLKNERVGTISKYLRQLALMKKGFNQDISKIQDKDKITDSKDTILNSEESTSSFHHLKKIDDKFRKQMFQRISKSCKDLTVQGNFDSQMQNHSIVELDQEQEICEGNISPYIKNQINISPNLYNNFIHNKIQKLSPQKQQNVVLDFSQQNKDFREKNSQIIQMIRNVQQHISKQREEERQNLEKDYKIQKVQRQKERKEGLHNAQVGLKDRRLKLLLNALKGSQSKQNQDPLVLNIKKKQDIKGNQSTIISRKSSFQYYNLNCITDKQNDEKMMRKFSQVSDICSSETSLGSNCYIQFPRKLSKGT